MAAGMAYWAKSKVLPGVRLKAQGNDEKFRGICLEFLIC